MTTIETLHKKVLEYLNSVDLSTLSMQDLNTYIFALNALYAMEKSDYMDTLLKMASSGMALEKAETREGK